MKGITRTLSSYIASSRYDDLPPQIRHEGVRAFVNWVGCAVGGSRDDTVLRALQVFLGFKGAPIATVVGHREKLDALNAAFVNAMSSSALAFNDTHYITVAHPTGPAAAALLALAESQPLSGREFLHALVLGIEIQCRVGNILCVPPAKCQVSFSMAGLVGGIGAAVAAAKVLGLDEAGIATAIGHAANHASGLREAQGTMAGALTRGHAARDGLMAAMLAAREFTCSETMIEGSKGFAVSYGEQPNLAAAVKKLGLAFEISTLAYKPYPCGFVIHPAIEACLDMARSTAIDLEKIQRVEVNVNPLAVQLTNRADPKNRRQALLSLQHWVATSLIYQAAGVAQVAEAVIHDPAVCGLRRKIILKGLESVGREAAMVQVVLKDGKRCEGRVRHCRGSPGYPLTDEDITHKTLGQLQTVYPIRVAKRIVAECWRVGDCRRVDALCKRLSV